MASKKIGQSCCGIDFKEASGYAKHVETAHGAERMLCCGIGFESAPKYAEHLRAEHGAK